MSNPSKTFSCTFPKCLKTYGNKFNLHRHIEVNHGNSKRFRCRQCGKYLSSKQNLKEHKNIHSQRFPYKCKEPLCGMTFSQTSQYSNHKKLHREILLMAMSLQEPLSLVVITIQLTDYFKEATNEVVKGTSVIDIENIELPKISKPQISVTLPKLSLHYFAKPGELLDKTDDKAQIAIRSFRNMIISFEH